MKKLEFAIDVAVNKEKLWDTMLDPVTYKEWVNETWPGSYFEGKWRQGETLRFISPGRGGTQAVLEDVKPYSFIAAKHTAVIRPDGSADTESDIAKGWIGTTETYSFTEKNGKTTLVTTMNVNPEWAQMFVNDWPKALESLKKIAER